jgi:predicted metalloprotease
MTVPSPAGRRAVEARRARNAPRLIGLLGVLGILAVVAIGSLIGTEESRLGDPLADLDTASSGGRLDVVELMGEPDEVDTFTADLLEDVDTAWTRMFGTDGDYHESTRVVFREFTDSSCNGADQDAGPHYCPADEVLYLDQTFFDRIFERRDEGEGVGSFAEAWLLAHLVGHHVQHQLGITEQVQQLSGDLSEQFELQADCLAGVWGFTLAQRGVLIGADTLDEATALLAEIGAERVSEPVSGSLGPEDWGHATAGQRVEWFLRGYESGDPTQCDPFAGG